MITIENKQEFTQKRGRNNGAEKDGNMDLGKVLVNHLKTMNEYDESNISVGADNNLCVKNLSPITLNKFLLEAEKLGHSIKYETNTTVKVL